MPFGAAHTYIPYIREYPPPASAIPVQCSTNWAIKPSGSWSRVCNIPIEGEMQIAMNIWKIIYSHVIFCNSFLGVWKCGEIRSFVIDILYQTWDSQRLCFIGISKHRVKSWKYNAQRSIFDEIWGVWIVDETMFGVFDISCQSKQKLRRKQRSNRC